MEGEIVKASGSVLTARRAGIVEYVSAEKIIIRVDERACAHDEDWIFDGVEIYHLRKFQRSSFSTWIHHTPIVKRGDRVEEGTILTNGPAIADGELALGTNVLVAFMPWYGYNFEDAIVVSERLVSDDSLTSVHIDEYVVEARDTKLGPEEITRDIPNVSESELVGLDEDGIVRIGTRVKPGDILVGKVTLKGDVQYSPEEKLLRAIFREKSREVRDTSLRVPPGGEGVIIDVKIFSRSGVRKDKRYKDEVAHQVAHLNSDYQQHESILQQMVLDKVCSLLAGQKVAAGMPAHLVKSDHFVAFEKLRAEPIEVIWECKATEKKINEAIKSLRSTYENQLRVLAVLKEERIGRFKKGDVLPSGVIKMIKVYIAMKRSISVGDKIAGRHGNKGVVSTIVAREDMPLMTDGTAVDVILNPLGVPSRMNVGQILETALGLVGKKLGDQLQEILATQGYAYARSFLEEYYGATFIDTYEKEYGKEDILALARKTAEQGVVFKTPVFEGAQFDSDIKPLMEQLNLPVTGAFQLRDGRTGEVFDQPVTVGVIYMMKLNHMVDDKLHARSVGPYSLVTRQPLGGKAQQGGQRLGEMEVWALEAYGAAHALQEMLTYKSDDVSGRHKAYSAIVRGEDIPEPGVPESFNVLIKELQSLGLKVDLLKIGRENVGG
jgi:DNA-directed RNA polymerase subunit beta